MPRPHEKLPLKESMHFSVTAGITILAIQQIQGTV
jgi:hypothetical protein